MFTHGKLSTYEVDMASTSLYQDAILGAQSALVKGPPDCSRMAMFWPTDPEAVPVKSKWLAGIYKILNNSTYFISFILLILKLFDFINIKITLFIF